MAEYPKYELKILYDCSLCKNEHTSTSRLVGSQLAAELAGSIAPGGQSLLKRGKEIAKRNLVRDFFSIHPEAKVSDFDVDKLIGHEMVQHTEDDEKELDKIGIPMVMSEVENWHGELMAEKGEAVVAKEKELSIEELEKLGPIETGIKKGMDFDGVEGMVKKRLAELIEREKQLSAELLLVQHEKKQFQELADAAEKARLDTKMKDLKKE